MQESEKTTNKPIVLEADKPPFANPGARMCPMISEVETQALSRRQKVMMAPDALPKTGKCWYVSTSGSAHNDGSEEHPWDSTDTLNANNSKLSAGDTVLFERGCIFRGFIQTVNGVSYGAYGYGDKPCLYGTLRNQAGDVWRQTEDGLWTVDEVYPADVGNIIFDHGEMVGYKRNTRAEVKANYDFWCDHDDDNRFYIYFDFDPNDHFTSVEVAFNRWMFRIDAGAHDILVENMTFRYCGGHGVRASAAKNITVRGCEFGFIGGCYLSGYKDGLTRYGNAVEFMGGCENVLVENNWIYQIYDSGITHQGGGDYCASDLMFRNNLIEYCGMGSIEYWLAPEARCKNVTYDGNIMRFSGYNFGGIQRPIKYQTAHVESNGKCANGAENFRIINNIFEGGTYDLIDGESALNTPPTLYGNTYIQARGSRLGSLGASRDVLFDDDVERTIKEVWGDTAARVIITDAVSV